MKFYEKYFGLKFSCVFIFLLDVEGFDNIFPVISKTFNVPFPHLSQDNTITFELSADCWLLISFQLPYHTVGPGVGYGVLLAKQKAY